MSHTNIIKFWVALLFAVHIAGFSNSNCSVGHMTYKVTRGPHYDADARIAVPFTS